MYLLAQPVDPFVYFYARLAHATNPFSEQYAGTGILFQTLILAVECLAAFARKRGLCSSDGPIISRR
jgi:hypothetical protein